MASSSSTNPDIWGWLNSLPPIPRFNTTLKSFPICSSDSSHPSLNFSILTNHPNSQTPTISFTITADYHIPISLWTSDPFKPTLDQQTLIHLFINIVDSVIRYGPSKKPYPLYPTILIDEHFKEVFNLVIITLTLLLCIYEAPGEVRSRCTDLLRVKMRSPSSKQAFTELVRVLGSNLEIEWMRSLGLAITSWIVEVKDSKEPMSSLSPAFFSYAVSANRIWKVQLYCPIVAMSVEEPSTTIHDQCLKFSLNYQQMEGVIQFSYKVVFRDSWIDVVVKVDNIRCDVSLLVSETLMSKRGYGSEEKHFPSRISLQLTPTIQTDVLSISVSKSSENPEVGVEKGLQGSFEPSATLGIQVSASEAVTLRMKPWKFEQSVFGNSATLNVFLHDGVSGKEVFSTKPSKFRLLQHKAWFRNRYSSVYRPFTRQGGVVFAGDEYGESVCWRVLADAEGKTMEWEIKGQIWVTYWPHKHMSFQTETRKLEFTELLQIPLLRIT